MTTLVALTLAGWANQDGNGARPSVQSIADGCRLKRRVVTDHIKKLADAGWVRRTQGRGLPNAYTLTIPMAIEGQIEAVLGEWNGGEVRHGDALPDDEVGHLDGPSTAPGRRKYGMGMPTSLTEPYIEPVSELGNGDLSASQAKYLIDAEEQKRKDQQRRKVVSE